MSILLDAAKLIASINDDAEAFEVEYTLTDLEGDDVLMDCVDFMNATERKFWRGGDISNEIPDL